MHVNANQLFGHSTLQNYKIVLYSYTVGLVLHTPKTLSDYVQYGSRSASRITTVWYGAWFSIGIHLQYGIIADDVLYRYTTVHGTYRGEPVT